jgi:hypothetical protein
MLLVIGFCAESLAQRYINEGNQTLVADGAVVENLDGVARQEIRPLSKES